MKTETPEEVVVRAESVLFDLADTCAAAAAEGHAHPGLPAAPTGDLRITSKAATIGADLHAAQREEVRRKRTEVAEARAVIAADARGEEVSPAADLPNARVVPVELLVILVIGIVEVIALSEPVGTMLDLPEDGAERYLIPAVVALIAAALAHQYGQHRAAACRSRIPDEQDAERRSARRYAAAVLGVAALAVIARLASAAIDVQLAGGTTLAPEGIAFFCVFQLAFAICALALAQSLHHRRDRADQQRTRRWVKGLCATVEGGTGRIEEAPERHQDQRDQLATTVRAAVIRFREGVEQQHPDARAQVGWRERTARDDDAGHLPLVPDRAEVTPSPAPAAPAPADPAAPAPAPAAVTPAPATTNPAGINRPDDDDLFAAVLTPT